MKKRNKLKLVILTIIILINLYVLVNAVSIWNYAEVDETRDADVIIVLGAAAYNTGPSPVYRERLNHAVRLYNEGYADYIIVSGGFVDGNQHSDAYIGKEYLVEKGITEEVVFMEEESVITEENLEYSKIIMQENDFEDALIVSDPLHMKRAMYLCNRCDITGYSSPTSTTMYRSWNTKMDFLLRELFYYTGYQVIDLF